MDNMNTNMLNLIASFKKTGQSNEVIKQSLWQMGMIPEVIDSHLDYFDKHSSAINKENNIVKENKDMKLTLEKLHKCADKVITILESMTEDRTFGYSANTAKMIIENCMKQLMINKDDEMVLQEKIKMGYKIDDTLVNPVVKYAVAEGMHAALVEYDWLQPVSDLRAVIAESFIGDKWSYVAAKFANSLANKSDNAAYANLYESLVDVLVDEENVRFALKEVLLENAWNKDAKEILAAIVAEEKSEQGKVDERIYENSNCSIRKNISPCIIDGENKVFWLHGKNYIYNGKSVMEAAVSDRRYINVLEGLSLLNYDSDKDRLVYYGKKDMMLEYNCGTDKLSMTGIENLSEKSLLDIHESLRTSGMFDMENIADCEKLVKFYESKDLLRDMDIVTTIQNNNIAGLYVSVINVTEGIYVNKVNIPFGVNEMSFCKTAKDACKEIKDFMKYDATTLFEAQLKEEGDKAAIVESKRNEIKDTLAFLSEKRAQLVAAIQETDNNEQLKSALALVESEVRKFEKQLQESYLESPARPEVLKFDRDEMIKNGYTEVTVVTPVEGIDKDEKVLVSATEYGQLDDDALITVFKADGKNIMVPKMNLKVEI